MITRVLTAAMLLIASTAFAQSPFIPNDIKYKDSGIKPATGRSGSATIEAYALLGKDGTAAIEVSAPAPGVIEKVQVKRVAYDQTTNFNGIGSNTFSAAMTGLAPGETVRIQANVSGIDGARMDVVTAETVVARRPDLSVETITAAPHAVAGGPIRIAALVRELNGDVGARASCVLSANGIDVDRADNIWIDAGGSVNCLFAPNFTAVGEQAYTVRLDNVRPGDDNPLNNAASSSIELYDSATGFTSWSASIFEDEHTTHTLTRAYWGQEEELEIDRMSESMMSGYIANRNADILNLKVSTREATDGQTIFEAYDFELDVAPAEYPTQPICTFTRNGQFQFWEACDIPFAFRQPRSFFINVWRMAGWITYHSNGWNTTMPTNTPPGYYTWNRTAEGGWGEQTRLGATYEWQLTISNGNELWENAGVAPITTTTSSKASSGCSMTPSGQICVDRTRTSVSKRANANGYN
jgi:hypothetical protein